MAGTKDVDSGPVRYNLWGMAARMGVDSSPVHYNLWSTPPDQTEIGHRVWVESQTFVNMRAVFSLFPLSGLVKTKEGAWVRQSSYSLSLSPSKSKQGKREMVILMLELPP